MGKVLFVIVVSLTLVGCVSPSARSEKEAQDMIYLLQRINSHLERMNQNLYEVIDKGEVVKADKELQYDDE